MKKIYNNKLLIFAVLILLTKITLGQTITNVTYTVTKTDDPDPFEVSDHVLGISSHPNVEGTFRWAWVSAQELTSSNPNEKFDITIDFNFSTTGEHVIGLEASLPTMENPFINNLTIDGYTLDGIYPEYSKIIIRPVVEYGCYGLSFQCKVDIKRINFSYFHIDILKLAMNHSGSKISQCKFNNYDTHAIYANGIYASAMHILDVEIIDNYFDYNSALVSSSSDAVIIIAYSDNHFNGWKINNNIIKGGYDGINIANANSYYGDISEFDIIGNVISNTKRGITLEQVGTKNIYLEKNIFFSENEKSINLVYNSNENKLTPIITIVTTTSVSGMCSTGDKIELFRSIGSDQNANEYIDEVTDIDEDGIWEITGLTIGMSDCFVATATGTGDAYGGNTNQLGCTSELSNQKCSPDCYIDIISTSITNVTCYGYNDGKIDVTLIGAQGAVSYELSSTGSTFCNSCNNYFQNITGVFNSLEPCTYTITVTDELGCSDVVSGLIVQTPENLNVSAATDDIEICEGESVDFDLVSNISTQMNACFYSTFPNTYTCSWDFGSGATPQTSTLCTGNTVVYDTPGEYTAELTVTGDCINGNYTQNISVTPTDNCVTCADCIGTFAPYPGAKYLVTAWVKEDVDNFVENYEYATIIIEYLDWDESEIAPGQQLFAKSTIIDGWQKIEEIIEIPAGTEKIGIRLMNNYLNNTSVYFDDIRFQPFNSTMKTYVYDLATGRLKAENDENNYATFYEYDEEGALIRIKKETERGIMTIQESISTSKKQNP